jgi:trans-aconitate 2-methyltransferase
MSRLSEVRVWDPAQYGRYANERSRPFFDLTARVGAAAPGYVADLGCGSGELTAALAGRWPGAAVVGVDSSPEMIEAARAHAASDAPPEMKARLSFVLGDIREWQPSHPLDVLISNAVLQWVPDHLGLLTRWAALLAAGGWLAVQVPGNVDQPSHAVLRELAASRRWRQALHDVRLNRQAADPAEYLELLARAGCEVDTWETTYLHVLHGADPVLDWYKGTGLRPVLATLDTGQAAGFLAEYGQRMRDAYPPLPFGTVLPFRRVFVVARKSA